MSKPKIVTSYNPAIFTYYKTRVSDDGLPPSNTTTRSIIPYTDSKSGVDKPNWKWLVRHHWNATTSFTGVKTLHRTEQAGFLSAVYRLKNASNAWVTYDTVVQGDIMFNPPTMSPWASSEEQARNQAKSRFIKRCIAAQTQFQGSVAMGELAETLRMIRNPGKELFKGIRDYLSTTKKVTRRIAASRLYRRLNREKRQKAISKAITSTWLEKSFGWDPLISDIEGAADTLARRNMELAYEYTKVRAGGRVEAEPVFSAVQSQSYDRVQWSWQHMTVQSCEVRFYGEVKREIYDQTALDMKSFGFRPEEFLPTVWELIPYSFLVDYFTNIGDVIRAWSYHNISLAWVGESVRKNAFQRGLPVKHDWQASKTSVEAAGGKWIGASTSWGKYQATRRSVQRRIPVDALVETFQWQIPGMTKQWLNIGALLADHESAKRVVLGIWRRG